MVDWVLKKTFFGHFCGGEDGKSIQPVIALLQKNGVGAILEYAVEADLDPAKLQRAEKTGHSKDVESARVLEYHGEGEAEANTEVVLSSIEAASHQENGFAAVKVSALGYSDLLEHISDVQSEVWSLFVSLESDES
eukprot:EC798587.1.p2 GENE.EC798587.1~~EC798587.1.p2  ORF type:complete len:136 (+),score=49.29 EC798587.1:314-721(+)